ncbi:MAG TPA: GNAT family N-acetyltransferase [Longimicrobium sp.]|nr:GNAT family N-acetyltransferase [Longimicrobium sp.]
MSGPASAAADAFRVLPLDPADAASIERAAALLVEGFREHAPRAWPDMDAARAEVAECLNPEWIILGAFGAGGVLVGWIGGQPQYYGDVWELHPMVVDERFRRRGIGRMLVRELERRLRERGVLTLYLGTDDEDERTSIGGVEVFPGVLDGLRELRNLGGHPFEAYERLGFEVIGVIPHANGFGRPDIQMAKSLRAPDRG